MAACNARFTAWFTEEERAGLAAIAKEHSTSQNVILRVALRAALGLSLPKWAAGENGVAPPVEVV